MTDHARPARYQQMSAEAAAMLELGESGRCEFKSTAEAVSSKVLASLANWVALDPGREVAHLLVGVDEEEDKATGLVRGVPCGLPKGLDNAVARIQDLAKHTRPIPVDVFIIEEDVAGPRPFVRVEVRATMPPHFDDEGRRQTRQGRSTRALTDDELLRIYLDREAGSFAERFRQAGVELRAAVGAVGSQVDQIAGAIDQRIARPLADISDAADYAASASGAAEDAATMVSGDVHRMELLLRDVQQVVDSLEEGTPGSLAGQVAQARRSVWWEFTVDTWERTSAQALRLDKTLRALLSVDIPIDPSRNAWELGLWEDLLAARKKQRRQRGTLKWWAEAVKEVADLADRPVYAAPQLPDLRSELQADLDKAVSDPTSLTSRFSNLIGE
ncbi:AlbA family DNA-binding domain-containing protein [Cellulosimicrobium funkei]|uniref:AlbA family DNA-binding domain-containing protein n=1 Tax=Cellulosimicrobium funkei TaxID=264251 RepID=UPI003D7071DC